MRKPEVELEGGLRLEYRGGDPVLVLPPRHMCRRNLWMAFVVTICALLVAWLISDFWKFGWRTWLPFLALFTVPVLVSACFIFGHTELRYTGGELVRENVWGPFRFRRRLPVASMSALIVGDGSARTCTGTMTSLRVLYSDGLTRTVTWSYPPALIRWLGHELSEILHIPFEDALAKADAGAIDALPWPEAFKVIRDNDRTRIEIRTVSTTSRMLVFGLVGIIGLVTQLLPERMKERDQSGIVTWLILGCVVLLMLALLRYLVATAAGRVRIVTDARGLELELARPLGHKRHSWTASEIAGVDVKRLKLGGVLDLNTYELVVLLRDRTTVPVLVWPNEGELHLLARALETQLGLEGKEV